MGDYNAVFDVSHRQGGNPIDLVEMEDGCACLDDLNLSFVKSLGQFYSWHKGSEGGLIRNRIDHCLCNNAFPQMFPYAQVMYLSPGCLIIAH